VTVHADCFSRLPLGSFAPYGEGPTDVTPTTKLNMLHEDRRNNDHSEDESDVCNAFSPPRDVETWTAVEWAIQQREDPTVHILKNKAEGGDLLHVDDIQQFYRSRDSGITTP
jgi:hypothetical protein